MVANIGMNLGMQLMGSLMGGLGDALGGLMGGDKSNAGDMKEALGVMKEAQSKSNMEIAEHQAKMLEEHTDRSIDQMNFDNDMADFKQDARQAQTLMNTGKEIATDAAAKNTEKTNEYNDKMRDLV